MKEKKKMVISIDGPAGAGKSSLARLISRRLGYVYVDTGAMYRALTLKVLENHVDPEDQEKVLALARNTDIKLRDENGVLRVLLDGRDVTDLIRSSEVSKNTSPVAEIPGVRELLVNLQREAGKNGGVVMEGRDIGTVVFPEADYKFYLDASIEERARRRWRELAAKGEPADLKKIEESIKKRDERDRTREVNPLVIPKNAEVIDSTRMTLEEVVEYILSRIGHS